MRQKSTKKYLLGDFNAKYSYENSRPFRKCKRYYYNTAQLLKLDILWIMVTQLTTIIELKFAFLKVSDHYPISFTKGFKQ